MADESGRLLQTYVSEQDKTVRTDQVGNTLTSYVLSGRGTLFEGSTLDGMVKGYEAVGGYTLESLHEEVVEIVRRGDPLPKER